jgi:hypothetical protein
MLQGQFNSPENRGFEQADSGGTRGVGRIKSGTNFRVGSRSLTSPEGQVSPQPLEAMEDVQAYRLLNFPSHLAD